LVGRDDEKGQVEPGGAGHHRTDEVFVARDVHHAADDTAAQIEGGEVEVDGDAPAPLFGQAVDRVAGKRGDERRFPVVDVTGRADDHALSQGRRVQNSSAG